MVVAVEDAEGGRVMELAVWLRESSVCVVEGEVGVA